MRLRLAPTIAWMLICLGTADVYAAGMFLPGHGVRSLGRAGASVASGAKDLNSLWYNPANLAPIDRLTLMVDVTLIDLSFSFHRAPRQFENGDRISFEKVKNSAPPKPNPQILIGGPTGIPGLAWAAGVYAPYVSPQTFPENGPQRYILIDNAQSFALYGHLALAYELGDSLRIGAGFQNIFTRFHIVNKSSGYTGLFGDPEDADLDILTQIDVLSPFTPTGNLGVWWRIAPWLELGSALQLPFVITDDDAKITVRLPSHVIFNPARVTGDTIRGSLHFPMLLRLGLRWVAPRFDVELAGVWEDWSVFDKIEATPNDITLENVPGLGSIPVGTMSIPQNYQDTLSLRLGTTIQLQKPPSGESQAPWELRLGYGFETGAIPDDRYSVFLADGTKHVLAAGATHRIGDLAIDLGLSALLFSDRNITQSTVTQINSTDVDNEITTTVGNGLYEQRYLYFGLGTEYVF